MTTHVNSHVNSTPNSSSSDEPDLNFDAGTHETSNGIDDPPEVASLVAGKKTNIVEKTAVAQALTGPDNSVSTRKAK